MPQTSTNKEQTAISPPYTTNSNRSVAHDSLYIIYQAVCFFLLSFREELAGLGF